MTGRRALRRGDRAVLSVIVPVYNEERTVLAVLRRVLGLGGLVREVLVVDDGSTDATPRLVEGFAASQRKVRFFRPGGNRGKTAAVRHALRHARGEVVIVQDADLEYDPAEIPNVVAPILRGEADVVYGSRFLGRRPAHVTRRCHYLANAALTFLSNRLSGLRLTDMETCYKAFRHGVLAPLELTSGGFGMEVEVTALVARTRARTREVPVSYRARSYRDGKKIGVRDGVMAGLYLLWYNLIQPWLPAGRRYVRAVNDYLERQPVLTPPSREPRTRPAVAGPNGYKPDGA